MSVGTLLRGLMAVFAAAFFSLSTGAMAADQCASVKAPAECAKKAGCAWNGKACAAKAAKPAAPAKKDAGKAATAAKKDTAKKDAAKPATAAAKKAATKKDAGKKPAEVKPTEDPAAEVAVPLEGDVPGSETGDEEF